MFCFSIPCVFCNSIHLIVFQLTMVHVQLLHQIDRWFYHHSTINYITSYIFTGTLEFYKRENYIAYRNWKWWYNNIIYILFGNIASEGANNLLVYEWSVASSISHHTFPILCVYNTNQNLFSLPLFSSLWLLRRGFPLSLKSKKIIMNTMQL